MATELNGTITATISWTYTDIRDLGDNPSVNGSLGTSLKFVNGANDGQADKVYAARLTIAAGGSVNLDLAGSLIDYYGASIVFAKIKGLIVSHPQASLASLVKVRPGASNGWNTWIDGTGPKIHIPKKGVFLLGVNDIDGFAVTAGTGDILTIENADGTNAATVQIALLGA